LLPATREERTETDIAAPLKRVLAMIADVEAQPAWRDVGSVTRTGYCWVEVTAEGQRITLAFIRNLCRIRTVLCTKDHRVLSRPVLKPCIGA